MLDAAIPLGQVQPTPNGVTTMTITFDDFLKVDVRIGPFLSACLDPGIPDTAGNVGLVPPALPVPNGGWLF